MQALIVNLLAWDGVIIRKILAIVDMKNTVMTMRSACMGVVFSLALAACDDAPSRGSGGGQASVQTPAKPAVIHSELGEAGKSLYIRNGCIGCHGAGGQSRNPGKFPALAGQSAAYLVQQLQDFKSYKRRNPMMSSVAVNLKDEDIPALAAYLSEL